MGTDYEINIHLRMTFGVNLKGFNLDLLLGN